MLASILLRFPASRPIFEALRCVMTQRNASSFAPSESLFGRAPRPPCDPVALASSWEMQVLANRQGFGPHGSSCSLSLSPVRASMSDAHARKPFDACGLEGREWGGLATLKVHLHEFQLFKWLLL